eukprot:GEZU01001158.1.p1 GENE.GEZU01001158.1~~GEZU01001158.1.p1  ORF type:complete len:175 (+),score=47.41 GEZU01001158.1:54-527(+)
MQFEFSTAKDKTDFMTKCQEYILQSVKRYRNLQNHRTNYELEFSLIDRMDRNIVQKALQRQRGIILYWVPQLVVLFVRHVLVSLVICGCISYFYVQNQIAQIKSENPLCFPNYVREDLINFEAAANLAMTMLTTATDYARAAAQEIEVAEYLQLLQL